MSVAVTIIVLLLITNVVGVCYFYSKQKKALDMFEEEKFKMAEANLKLLEQSELLEEQKFKLAEGNIKLLEQKEIIEEERARSEKLLLNVLPRKVADQLKECGKTDPEHFENVSVFFSDIVNFTSLAEMLQPKVLINELNEIFTAFDHIIEKNSCERIKTIGDAYLCVCGMPEKNEKHAFHLVKSALEIIEFLHKRNLDSEIKWQIRVGIHSGRVVGGVVGIKKYIYDVFGDTINTASRLENHSEPMRINISETTYLLVKDHFDVEPRAPVEVKGKGMINMYFVNTHKP